MFRYFLLGDKLLNASDKLLLLLLEEFMLIFRLAKIVGVVSRFIL